MPWKYAYLMLICGWLYHIFYRFKQMQERELRKFKCDANGFCSIFTGVHDGEAFCELWYGSRIDRDLSSDSDEERGIKPNYVCVMLYTDLRLEFSPARSRFTIGGFTRGDRRNEIQSKPKVRQLYISIQCIALFVYNTI